MRTSWSVIACCSSCAFACEPQYYGDISVKTPIPNVPCEISKEEQNKIGETRTAMKMIACGSGDISGCAALSGASSEPETGSCGAANGSRKLTKEEAASAMLFIKSKNARTKKLSAKFYENPSRYTWTVVFYDGEGKPLYLVRNLRARHDCASLTLEEFFPGKLSRHFAYAGLAGDGYAPVGMTEITNAENWSIDIGSLIVFASDGAIITPDAEFGHWTASSARFRTTDLCSDRNRSAWYTCSLPEAERPIALLDSEDGRIAVSDDRSGTFRYLGEGGVATDEKAPICYDGGN